MYHYVYKLEHIETKEFYIGSRSSSINPELDDYMGSMKVWKPDKSKLIKTIIRDDFLDRTEAIVFESDLILSYISNSLNRNYSIPSRNFFVKKGQFLNKKHKRGRKNSQYGTCWITNGIINKKIIKKENTILDDGWFFGRKIKNIEFVPKSLKISGVQGGGQKGKNNSQYDTHWITNDIENKKIKNNETIPEGWHRGCINRKMIGYRWITNGVNNKKLKKNETMPSDWYLGRVL